MILNWLICVAFNTLFVRVRGFSKICCQAHLHVRTFSNHIWYMFENKENKGNKSMSQHDMHLFIHFANENIKTLPSFLVKWMKFFPTTLTAQNSPKQPKTAKKSPNMKIPPSVCCFAVWNFVVFLCNKANIVFKVHNPCFQVKVIFRFHCNWRFLLLKPKWQEEWNWLRPF